MARHVAIVLSRRIAASLAAIAVASLIPALQSPSRKTQMAMVKAAMTMNKINGWTRNFSLHGIAAFHDQRQPGSDKQNIVGKGGDLPVHNA